MNSCPLISVLIPVYNAEDEILDSVNSIIQQTYSNLEIIIIDDCSNDSTLERLRNISDSRLKIFKNKRNLQIAATLNRGMKVCKGKYVARMDADDYSMPDRLMKQYQFLETNPDYLLVGSSYLVEEDGKKLGIRKQVSGYKRLRSKLLFGNNICHPSILINKHIWFKHNLSYNANFKYAQDYDLWTRAIINCKMTNLQEPLIIYRRSDKKEDLRKADIIKENFRKSLMNYIKLTFDGLTNKETEDLYEFFRNPKSLSRILLIKFYLKSLRIIFKPKNFNRLDYFLRVNNQLLKGFNK